MVIPKIKQYNINTKKRGAIINISSIAAVATPAMTAVYNGTKGFVDFFSQSVGV